VRVEVTFKQQFLRNDDDEDEDADGENDE